MKTIIALGVVLALAAGCAQPQRSAERPADDGGAKEIRAAYVTGELPSDPGDAVWQKAGAVRVPLTEQNVIAPRGGGSVSGVTVRALHNGRYLAMRFEWQDATSNREVGVDRFRDAVAVGFPAHESETLPSPFMGDPEHPVNVWQWTADFDANAQGQGAFADNYPHTEGVWYFPQDYAVTRDVVAWRGFEPVIELMARGFGTLERKVSQNVLGLGVHDDGRWTVVLRRELTTGHPEDTLFRPGEATHAIFAVWDGGAGEVNGLKGVTLEWWPLVLEPTVVASRTP